MLDYLVIMRALGDENRVRILMALRQRALCVCQVTAFLDLAPSTTSKHLSILRQARLIKGRKQGRWVYYQLAGEKSPVLVRAALDSMQRHLEHDPVILRDEAHFAEIIRAEAACGMEGHLACEHSSALHAWDVFQTDENVGEQDE